MQRRCRCGAEKVQRRRRPELGAALARRLGLLRHGRLARALELEHQRRRDREVGHLTRVRVEGGDGGGVEAVPAWGSKARVAGQARTLLGRGIRDPDRRRSAHISQRATGTALCSTSATADAAAASEGKVQTAAAAAGGTACSRSLSSVITPGRCKWQVLILGAA